MQPSLDVEPEDIIGDVGLEDVDRSRKKMLDLESQMLHLASMGEWNRVHLILTHGDPLTIRTIRTISLQPINSSNDTLLHLAATEGKREVVKELLMLMKQENELQLIGSLLVNVAGNTPLHLAAANGHDETCRLIMEEAPWWGETMNEDGETPIFLAALAGSKEVFSTLSSMHSEEIALRRRNDGDTILHCAIFGEYFDIARDIIERYSQLLHYRNERGLTPLHILASTPDAFRSGWQLGYLDHAIYFSIEVSTDEPRPKQKKQENYPSELPANYYLCWTTFKLLRRTFAALGASRSPSDGATEEAGVMVLGSSPTTTMASESPRKQGGRGNANSFKGFFRNLLVAFLVIVGFFGLATRITQLRKKKEKHVRASEVMNLCLGKIRTWSDFGEILKGMDPNMHRRKTSDINLVTVSQRGSPPQSDPASSGISQTDSDTPPSIIDASSYQLKEDTANGNVQA